MWLGLVGKLWPPGRLMLMSTHPSCHCQCLFPCSEPQPPPSTSTGDPPIVAGRSVQSLMRSLLLSLGPGTHLTSCAPSKSGVSISHSLLEFLRSNSTAFQSKILWGLLLQFPDPQAGYPDMGLRTFTPVGELLWYNYFPVCGSPTWQVCNLILS